MRWQPIDTAPLDGTLVLLLQWDGSDGYAFSHVDFGCFEFIEVSDWDGKRVYGWTSNRGDIEDPTHWMALPTAPEPEP